MDAIGYPSSGLDRSNLKIWQIFHLMVILLFSSLSSVQFFHPSPAESTNLINLFDVEWVSFLGSLVAMCLLDLLCETAKVTCVANIVNQTS